MPKSKASKGPKIDKGFCSKVLGVVDKGLTDGLGDPIPGKMCVEAAVAFASGEDHHDQPRCVYPALAGLKIGFNDDGLWSSDKARAKGLRRLAIAQLGTSRWTPQTWVKFEAKLQKRIISHTLRRIIQGLRPRRDDMESAKEFYGLTLWLSAPKKYDIGDALEDSWLSNASLRNIEGEWIDGLGSALGSFKGCPSEEKIWADYMEDVVQVLAGMKTPGSKFLYLTQKKKGKR